MTTPIDKLVHELSKLPSIGERTALRLALHIMRQPADYGRSLAKALHESIGRVHFCQNCFNLSERNLCPICENPKRDQSVLCVIEDIADLMAIEKTQAFKGVYHVLHGSLSPIDGIGPEDIYAGELVERLKNHPEIQEIIFATNPNVNGDATALYISKLIKPFDLRITKLASGIPIGGHIEFIDQHTLSRAMERRAEF